MSNEIHKSKELIRSIAVIINVDSAWMYSVITYNPNAIERFLNFWR